MYMIQTFYFTVATTVFVHRPKHASFVIYSEQCVYPTEAGMTVKNENVYVQCFSCIISTVNKSCSSVCISKIKTAA